MKLVECVPNFSEGRNQDVIKQITRQIEETEGAVLLDVDPGADTNRTVVTFIGTPEAVKEAAFKAIQKASQIIDMSKHQGAPFPPRRYRRLSLCPRLWRNHGRLRGDCQRSGKACGARNFKFLSIFTKRPPPAPSEKISQPFDPGLSTRPWKRN